MTHRGHTAIVALAGAIAAATLGTSSYAPADVASKPVAAVATNCAPPRGPGDNLVHSANLRVKGMTCSQGRVVALRCTANTYGHSGTCAAAGYVWRCTSYKQGALGSHQRCVAGPRIMSIDWLD